MEILYKVMDLVGFILSCKFIVYIKGIYFWLIN